MTQNTRKIPAIDSNGEQPQKQLPQFRRARNLDFRVTTDDDRVAVVTGMTPAPNHRFAQHHKRRDLVEEIVQPIRAEGSAMPGLMPTGVGRRRVEHRISHVGKHHPPCIPEREGRPACEPQQAEPQNRVANGRTVTPFEKFAHLSARNGALIPIGLGKPALDRSRGVLARETVVEVLRRTCECGCGVVVVHGWLGFWLSQVLDFGNGKAGSVKSAKIADDACHHKTAEFFCQWAGVG